ncbi:MAG: histidine triad nucleotide-binding protein [Clostridiales bacterium]|jgi:histidine triad (HIT) family protein|nr:histidine triad nucleotide-binding protein [Clostridiales bacterium]
MRDCIFCKIIKGEISGNKAYEDEDVLAVYDIDAKAPVHILILPKKHIKSVMELGSEDAALTAKLFKTAKELATSLELDKKGFRLVVNTGEDGGQSVAHLHMHLLGGRALGWPPG